MNPDRPIQNRYADPLDAIWLETAARCGFQVNRSDEVFASFDGVSTLTICTEDHFDPDDCLAQMIFHELCHALVMGAPDRLEADWGLENVDDRDAIYEHACHRLQATLADPHGLRSFLAPTTNYRPYYDALPPDPLAPGTDPAIELATEGWDRARHGAWTEPIQAALRATRALAKGVALHATDDSLWSRYEVPHRLGLPPGRPGEHCGDCAWAHGEDGQLRCALATRPWGQEAPEVDPEEEACRFREAGLTAASCGSCGACCREAYHQVPVEPEEAILLSRPELVGQVDGEFVIARPDGRCGALTGEGSSEIGFRCSVYDERPRHCRDFEIGGPHCLEARQRVGLSGRPR